MTDQADVHELPENLPIPEDDGAADHLTGMRLLSTPLASTAGNLVDLSALEDRTIVYCYPMTKPPEKNLPQGWGEIPGARGCTPQSCTFRDHFAELQALHTRVFGLSTQGTEYQQEAAKRLHLPFELLSDRGLRLAYESGLPTFEVEGMVLLKRLTFIANSGLIETVIYPVFPPNKNAEEVVGWLSQNRSRQDPLFERQKDGLFD
jgi:peroxiredoxin